MIDVVIDLSHHNAGPDFAQAAAAGVKGVLYKATQGRVGVDPTFVAAKAKARSAGLWWGAYHFGTDGDGVLQAQHFLTTVADPATTLLALDFEPNPSGASMTLVQARAFVTHVHQQTGRWPGLYSGHYIKQLLGNTVDPVLANCWFWLAQYGPKPVVPPCWSQWTMWQYSDGAIPPPGPAPVPGIGHCDRNRFNGDSATLAAFWPH